MNLRERTAIVIGASVLVIVGRDKFYRIAQNPGGGLIVRAARVILQGTVARLVNNFAIMRENIDRDRMSS